MPEKVRVSCLDCGATNNFPIELKGKRVVCGRCKNALPLPGQVLEPPLKQVVSLIQNARLSILIDFYSPTCAPCHMMHPVVENLTKRRAGEIMTIRVNIDSYPHLAARFGIKGVPTFVIISNGSERGRTTGAMPEMDFSLWVASLT